MAQNFLEPKRIRPLRVLRTVGLLQNLLVFKLFKDISDSLGDLRDSQGVFPFEADNNSLLNSKANSLILCTGPTGVEVEQDDGPPLPHPIQQESSH